MVRAVDVIERRGIVLITAIADLRCRHGRVRLLALVLADLLVPRRDRRRGHRQRGVPQPDSSARDARRAARTDDRRQHDVLHRRTAAGRARGGPARAVGRAGGVGGQRRHRLLDRHDVGRRGHARTARVSPHRTAAGAGQGRSRANPNGRWQKTARFLRLPIGAPTSRWNFHQPVKTNRSAIIPALWAH